MLTESHLVGNLQEAARLDAFLLMTRLCLKAGDTSRTQQYARLALPLAVPAYGLNSALVGFLKENSQKPNLSVSRT